MLSGAQMPELEVLLVKILVVSVVLKGLVTCPMVMV